jgi:glycosyltransferase involved in cell wall biosynthesis
MSAVRAAAARSVRAAVRAASVPRLMRSPGYARAWVKAVNRIGDRRLRAELLLAAARAEIARGPSPTLAAAVAAQLTVADRLLAAGHAKAAAAAVQPARLLFDRRLHFDRLTSPLADDPAGFLAPWHASATGRALCAPRGRAIPVAPRPTDRPVRLLIGTYGNHGFLVAVRRHFEDRPDVELRFVDPGIDGEHVPLLTAPAQMMEHILAGGRATAFGDRVEAWLRPHLDWADVAFIDWAAGFAVAAGLLDPGGTRMVVRLHSFEAFALWPHLLDPSRIDDFIFVSDLVRELGLAVLPALAAAETRTHVVTNAMDLRAFRQDKTADARFTVGVVGLKAVAKDPRWALEVLRHLRAADRRYRMAFYGKDLDPAASADARTYWDALQADIALLEPGALIQHGHVDDMPAALRGVGAILSSSVRESFHCALVEGAASGAVPVVRDWPFFAGRPASARSLFPADWVVDSPAAAARRILAYTADEQVWRAAGAEASRHAIASWDWDIVKHDFDRILLGQGAIDSQPAAARPVQ